MRSRLLLALLFLALLPVPALGMGFSHAVDASSGSADVSFYLAEKGNASISFSGLQPGVKKLVVLDKRYAYVAQADASGMMGVNGEFAAGNHTVGIMEFNTSVSGRILSGSWGKRYQQLKQYLYPALTASLVLVFLVYCGVAAFALRRRAAAGFSLGFGGKIQMPRIKRGHLAWLALFVALAAVYASSVWGSFLYDGSTPYSIFPYAAGQVLYLDRYYEMFGHSQYVIGPDSPGAEVMTDQQAYTWAGWLYIHGTDPALFNTEHPPLAKYLIGLSTLLFGRPALPGLLAGLASIAMMLYVANRIIGNWLWAFIATAAFTASGFFCAYAEMPYLDMPLLLVSLCFIAVLAEVLRGGKSNRTILVVLLALLVGIGLSIKLLGFIALVPAAAIFLAATGRRDCAVLFIALLPLAALPFMLSYSVYFADGHSLLDFTGMQANVIAWRIGANAYAQVPPLSAWQILFTGYAVYGGYYTSNWSITWPLFGLAAFAGAAYWPFRRDPLLLLALLWFFSFMLFYSTGPVWDRYLLPALPAAAIIFVYLAKDFSAWLVKSARLVEG